LPSAFLHLHNFPFVQMPASTSIGQRFTLLIQHLGMSKNAFAQSLDKTATVIQHLVDERNKPGYDLLCKVFEVYPNVSKDWLMEGDGPMLKELSEPGVAASPSFAPAPALAATASLFAPSAPEVAPVPPVATAAPTPKPAPASASPQPVEAPVAAPVPAAEATPAPAPAMPPAAPDPAYFTVALQTQYLQHQLALAEQRNQHLLEQQALMQQLVAVLQRNS
jgi:hypothetical protein